MTSDVGAFLRPILKRAQAGEHVEYERVGNTMQGSRRWLHGRIAPDLDVSGTVRGLYCTEYDIHDLKSTEQALAARERAAASFQRTTFPSRSSTWTRTAATSSSTRRSCG